MFAVSLSSVAHHTAATQQEGRQEHPSLLARPAPGWRAGSTSALFALRQLLGFGLFKNVGYLEKKKK